MYLRPHFLTIFSDLQSYLISSCLHNIAKTLDSNESSMPGWYGHLEVWRRLKETVGGMNFI